MIDFTHEDIERLWNSIIHYVPERQKLDMAIDFIKSLEDIGVEHDEIKASAEYDPKLEEAINTVFEKKKWTKMDITTRMNDKLVQRSQQEPRQDT
jgi:hypothetical protein